LTELSDMLSIVSLALSLIAVVTLIYNVGFKLGKYFERVDTLWQLFLSGGLVEGTHKGVLTHQSEIKVSDDILKKFPIIFAQSIKDWYEKEGAKLSEVDVAVQIAKRFGTQLADLAIELEVSLNTVLVASMTVVMGRAPTSASIAA
jgi:uncharacterized protein YneF (UPF0154 family)